MPLRRKAVLWSVLTPLALIAALVVIILTFDWNRLKPWLNQKVTEAIGRPFAVNGDLTLTWRSAEGETGWHTWVPWPRLSARDITVGNPEWAQEANFATVRELIFVLRPLPLLSHQISITSITVDSPAVWLERLADQRNNWTFVTPTSKAPSPWRLDIGEISLARGDLALNDQAMKIELQARLDTIGDAALYDKTRDGALIAPPESATVGQPGGAGAAGNASQRYGLRWKATGRYNQATINATGKAGTVLSLRDTQAPFPLQADVRVGNTRAVVEGTLTNPAHLGALDMHLQLSGDNMAKLYALTGIVLPSTPPYETRGRLVATLRKGASVYRYDKFSGRVGGSDLNGSLTYTQRQPRALLSGELESKQLRFEDLAPLIGADAKPGQAASDSTVRQPADKALPVAPFRTERWDSIDADVKFTGKRIIRTADLPVTDLVTHLKLDDGVLTLDPLNFGVAGGNLMSSLQLNGKREPLAATIDMKARHLQLKQLFPKFESMRASVGEVNGSAKLSATGNSVAALLGSSNGEAKLLVENGTVSKFLLEAMGLNVGSVVISKLFGDKPVQIHCGVSDFSFTNGVARSRVFVIDTQDAVIDTSGAIDLGSERLALTVRPDSKGLRVFSLRSPLYVGGTLKKPSVSPDIGVLALRAGGVVALALVAPVATAVLPLIDLSTAPDSQCGKLLAEIRKRPTAPPPGQAYRDPKTGKTSRPAGPAPSPDVQAAPAASAPVKPAAPSRPGAPDRPAPGNSLYQGG
ncbi:AsmA family protein [Cupriavidus basilensis]|uniref:Exported protein, conserved n=1 Tax=Cupriavidus basilensis TaxID=68895 RepID=A0A0C4YIC0_9BURK|nr:AsmA family protein [Cupriavidus basilensis]AJG20486.1 exported protein, conserved [Cupriavidus basilensis]